MAGAHKAVVERDGAVIPGLADRVADASVPNAVRIREQHGLDTGAHANRLAARHDLAFELPVVEAGEGAMRGRVDADLEPPPGGGRRDRVPSRRAVRRGEPGRRRERERGRDALGVPLQLGQPALAVGRCGVAREVGVIPPERVPAVRAIGDHEHCCRHAEIVEQGPGVREHAVVTVVEGERRRAAQALSAPQSRDELRQRYDRVPAHEPVDLFRESLE